MTKPDFAYETHKNFEPWKPFWVFAKSLGICTACFGISIGLAFLIEALGIRSAFMVTFALFFFLGMAFSSFAAVVAAWSGALATCPKCGSLFAGQYLATKCRNCGATLDELQAK